MTTPFRLAHFSDFHFRSLGKAYRRGVALLDDALAAGVDHICITGDIVDTAEPRVLSAFFGALREREWHTPDRLTVVPGNHDVYPVARKRFPALWRRPRRNLRRFLSMAEETSWHTAQHLLNGGVFPAAKILAPGVVVAGVSTVRADVRSPMKWAEGELDRRDMDAVAGFFDRHADAPHRVLAMHHHPWRSHYRHGGRWDLNFTTPDPETAGKWVVASGANLVLCGHTHEKNGVALRNLADDCLAVRAGTAGGMDDFHGERGRRRIWMLLELRDDGAREITPVERWDDELDAGTSAPVAPIAHGDDSDPA